MSEFKFQIDDKVSMLGCNGAPSIVVARYRESKRNGLGTFDNVYEVRGGELGHTTVKEFAIGAAEVARDRAKASA
jgi:hypothetical protein